MTTASMKNQASATSGVSIDFGHQIVAFASHAVKTLQCMFAATFDLVSRKAQPADGDDVAGLFRLTGASDSLNTVLVDELQRRARAV